MYDSFLSLTSFRSLAQPQTLKLDLVRCTLSFAVIVWFSKTNGCLLREPVSSLLSNVTKILLQEGSLSLVSKILGHTILTASSAAKKDLSFTDENREYLWQFATTSSVHELSIACEFWCRDLSMKSDFKQPVLRTILSHPNYAIPCFVPRPGDTLPKFYCSYSTTIISTNKSLSRCSHVQLCAGP